MANKEKKSAKAVTSNKKDTPVKSKAADKNGVPIKSKTVEKKDAPIKSKTVNKKDSPEKKQKKKLKINISDGNKRTLISIVAILIAAALIFLAVLRIVSFNIPKKALGEYKGVDVSDSALNDIELPISKQKLIAKNMKAKGDRKKFSFYCNTELVFDEWYSPATIAFANVTSNDCTLIYTIFIPEISKTEWVYKSLGVPAGKQMQFTDRLFNDLDYGTYDAKIVVAAYEEKEPWKIIGSQYVDAKLYIGTNNPTKSIETTVK